jgi:hypothetical protein
MVGVEEGGSEGAGVTVKREQMLNKELELELELELFWELSYGSCFSSRALFCFALLFALIPQVPGPMIVSLAYISLPRTRSIILSDIPVMHARFPLGGLDQSAMICLPSDWPLNATIHTLDLTRKRHSAKIPKDRERNTCARRCTISFPSGQPICIYIQTILQ